MDWTWLSLISVYINKYLVNWNFLFLAYAFISFEFICPHIIYLCKVLYLFFNIPNFHFNMISGMFVFAHTILVYLFILLLIWHALTRCKIKHVEHLHKFSISHDCFSTWSKKRSVLTVFRRQFHQHFTFAFFVRKCFM